MPTKSKPEPKRARRQVRSSRQGDAEPATRSARTPKPSDLERPAPNEPVRIQPPPEFEQTARPVSADAIAEEHAAPPRTSAPPDELDPEPPPPSAKKPRTKTPAPDPNRWVTKRFVARGAGWRSRPHPSTRGG